MSEGTKIQWATHTWNPWEGCTKVSAGCKNCYAETRNVRFHGGANWGKGAPRRRTSAEYWKQPERWNRVQWFECPACGRVDRHRAACECGGAVGQELGLVRPRVFPSLCDPFDREVSERWFADFLDLVAATPYLDWLLLTKRPENWLERMEAAILWGKAGKELAIRWRRDEPPCNVWMGVSVEDQASAELRILKLMDIPTRLRFLSVEPLLGMVDLVQLWRSTISAPPVDWVIVGGESGPAARWVKVSWIERVVRDCRAARIPVFVKQLGRDPRDGSLCCHGCTHEGPHPIKLKDSKGGDPSEWPVNLRVRQFPAPIAGPIPAGLAAL